MQYTYTYNPVHTAVRSLLLSKSAEHSATTMYIHVCHIPHLIWSIRVNKADIFELDPACDMVQWYCDATSQWTEIGCSNVLEHS